MLGQRQARRKHRRSRPAVPRHASARRPSWRQSLEVGRLYGRSLYLHEGHARERNN
jgi:hypothetical protein